MQHGLLLGRVLDEVGERVRGAPVVGVGVVLDLVEVVVIVVIAYISFTVNNHITEADWFGSKVVSIPQLNTSVFFFVGRSTRVNRSRV